MEELKSAFSQLSIQEKYNQINNELIIIGELIKMQEKRLNVPTLLSIKNYKTLNENEIQESKMLDFLYEDIYNIQKELMTLFSVDKYK